MLRSPREYGHRRRMPSCRHGPRKSCQGCSAAGRKRKFTEGTAVVQDGNFVSAMPGKHAGIADGCSPLPRELPFFVNRSRKRDSPHGRSLLLRKAVRRTSHSGDGHYKQKQFFCHNQLTYHIFSSWKYSVEDTPPVTLIVGMMSNVPFAITFIAWRPLCKSSRELPA